MDGRGKNYSRSDKAVLIYDGNCPICSNTVSWIIKHEQKDAFEMLPCQSEDRKKRYSFMEEATCMQAMQLVLPGGSVLAGENALPEILKRLKRYRAAAGLSSAQRLRVPSASAGYQLPGSKTIARAFYRWFAKHRYHIAKVLFRHENDPHHHGKKAA